MNLEVDRLRTWGRNAASAGLKRSKCPTCNSAPLLAAVAIIRQLRPAFAQSAFLPAHGFQPPAAHTQFHVRHGRDCEANRLNPANELAPVGGPSTFLSDAISPAVRSSRRKRKQTHLCLRRPDLSGCERVAGPMAHADHCGTERHRQLSSSQSSAIGSLLLKTVGPSEIRAGVWALESVQVLVEKINNRRS